MKTKTFEKVGLTIKYSDGELCYDDAVKQCPEGWRLIKPSMLRTCAIVVDWINKNKESHFLKGEDK